MLIIIFFNNKTIPLQFIINSLQLFWCNRLLLDKSKIFKLGIKLNILLSTLYIILFDKLNISNDCNVFKLESNSSLKYILDI